MALGNKYYFSGSISDLNLRITVHKHSFESDKDEGKESIPSQLLIEDLKLKWDADEDNLKDAKVISCKYEKCFPEKSTASKNFITKFATYINTMIFLPFQSTNLKEKIKSSVSKNTKLIVSIKMNEISCSDEYRVICTILLSGRNCLIINPNSKPKGYTVHGNSGNYVVNITFIENKQCVSYDPPMHIDRNYLTTVPSITPMDALNDFFIRFYISLEQALYFEAESVFIQWNVICQKGEVTGKTDGSTIITSQKKNGTYNFSEVFTITVLPNNYNLGLPLLKIKIFSIDKWGRQYLEGHTECLLVPNKTLMSIRLKTKKIQPTDAQNELTNFFLGYLPKRSKQLSEESLNPGPEIKCTILSVICSESKQIPSKEKVPISFGNMRMEANLFWRVMKALVDFDEARRDLMLAST